MSSPEEAKRQAARAALGYVPETGVIGLGTGSTAKFFIEAVAELVAAGRQLRAVPTSDQCRDMARSLGIPLLDDDAPWDIAVTVDGADEVNPNLDLIKGGGGAHTREKIVNFASRKNVIIVDESKLCSRLGERWAVPIEVLCFGAKTTSQKLAQWGQVELRMHNGAPLRTDSGNLIYDLTSGPIDDPSAFDNALRSVPGVVETGLFCGRADVVLVAGPSGVRSLTR